MYGVLLAGERVVALAQPRAQPLDPADLLLLASFVTGSDSFRAASESFSPICLPAYNPSAFLHAYVQYLDAVCKSSMAAPYMSFKPELAQSVRGLSRVQHTLPRLQAACCCCCYWSSWQVCSGRQVWFVVVVSQELVPAGALI